MYILIYKTAAYVFACMVGITTAMLIVFRKEFSSIKTMLPIIGLDILMALMVVGIIVLFPSSP